ncbi:hypothetical protein EV175_002490 [Coemansia sp. RSA 1933]|nr:hypothetical protein EV175_002490 [Coemansia sp. RSA 1933]
MRWHVQIVSPTTHNTGSTSVLVYFPGGRYLFNCGEGIQRLSFENKVRVSKLSAIFLSRINWVTMGGLPGMLLTMADSGMKDLCVGGGRNLTHALASTRHFLMRSDMGLHIREMLDGDHSETGEFRDSNVHIVPVHIYPDGLTAKDDSHSGDPNEAQSHKIRKQVAARSFGVSKQPPVTGDSGRGRMAKKDKKAKKDKPLPQAKKGHYNKCSGAAVEEHLQHLQKAEEDALEKKRAHSPEAGGKGIGKFGMGLPKTTPSSAAISYIIEGPIVPGKFDVAAAQALGLRAGPVFGKLAAGESVIAPNGDTIHPSQCIGPTRPGGIVVIIDCPSVDYIDSLTNHPKFAPYLDGDGKCEAKQKQLAVIVHGLGASVCKDERYKSWALRFPSHVRHVVSAPELVPDSNPFQRHLRVQAAVAAIDNKMFVLPQSSGTPDLPLNTFMSGKNAFAAEYNVMYDIEPKFKVDKSLIRPLMTPETAYNNVKATTSFQKYPRRDNSPPTATTTTGDDTSISSFQSKDSDKISDSELVICPVGTGSSVPSIYRNVSSNIISINGYGGIVLDCGESTVSLLKRFLGYPHRNVHNKRVALNYVEFVLSLKLLYISHMHADHHLGAVLLLQEWSRLTSTLPSPLPRLTVVAPWRFWAWLEDISGVQDVGFDRLDFVGCQDLRVPDSPQPEAETIKAADALKASLGLTEISTCHVVHCPWAYGLSITHKNGWRLVYSGDTRPCASLVALGRSGDRPPTVLLHEATHTDDLIKDAIAKRHTTASEAVAMALGMGAENLLMTHFSQRCLSLPSWNPDTVFSTKVQRYGQIAFYKRPQHKDGSTRGDDVFFEAPQAVEADHEEPLDEDFVDNTFDAEASPASNNSMPIDDLQAAKEELLRDMSDSSTDSGKGGSRARDRQKYISANVNIAVACDMSTFSKYDFLNYRRNIKLLKSATIEEVKLFMAEEQQVAAERERLEREGAEQSSKKRTPVSQKREAPPKGKQPAAGGAKQKNGRQLEKTTAV